VKLDLASIAGSPGARWKHDFTVALPKDEELDLAGPVTGTITVTNTGQLLLVRGKMAAKARVECARCGETFEFAVAAPIEEEFSIRGPEGAPIGPGDTIDVEEPAAAAFADNMLDLTELLRQQLLVSLPLTPLCRPDCKGICPDCGKNLNEGPCGCAEDRAASPFAVLESLIRDPNQEEPSPR
jgi:uncharacterized protein